MSLSVYTKQIIKFIWIGPLVYDIKAVKLVDMPCRRFPLGTPVSSANKTDRHDMT